MVGISDLALHYSLSTELVAAAVSPRIGTLIQGRLEGNLLYTPAYIRSVKARLRGALRGAAAPLVLTALVKVGAAAPTITPLLLLYS